MTSRKVLPLCLFDINHYLIQVKILIYRSSVLLVTHKILLCYQQIQTSCSTFMGQGHLILQFLNWASFHDLYFSSRPMASPFLSKTLRIVLAHPHFILAHVLPFLPALDLTLELRDMLKLIPPDPWLGSKSCLNKELLPGKSQLRKQKLTL